MSQVSCHVQYPVNLVPIPRFPLQPQLLLPAEIPLLRHRGGEHLPPTYSHGPPRLRSSVLTSSACPSPNIPASLSRRTPFTRNTSVPLYSRRPVAAGINFPMITFSLRPRRQSVFPSNAASVSTLVVSWKEAAAYQETI